MRNAGLDGCLALKIRGGLLILVNATTRFGFGIEQGPAKRTVLVAVDRALLA